MPSALDSLGSHLLGRVHVPDDQDWPLEAFLLLDYARRDAQYGDDPLDTVLAAVMKSRASAITKAFDAQVAAELKKLRPSPPPVPPDPVPPADAPVEWRNTETNLDQGQTPECVAFGWANFGNTDPVDDRYTNDDGHTLYREVKAIDGDTQDGSSTRSGAKAMQARGRIKNYAFTTNVETVRAWVRSKGSVVTGTDWYDGMFDVDGEGFVHATGSVAGGHEWAIVGDRPDLGALVGVTSWGAFGVNADGRFVISYHDYAMLLGASGDACAAVELPAA
jgi:hypothetical protein